MHNLLLPDSINNIFGHFCEYECYSHLLWVEFGFTIDCMFDFNIPVEDKEFGKKYTICFTMNIMTF